MHETVFYVAAVWMALLIGVAIINVLRARTTMTRILALDVVTILLIAFLILYADARRVSYYLDAALVLALLSFISTVAAAHYASRGRVFR
jgi:multisubunit Na+/H+ antiporter MnhF subunit